MASQRTRETEFQCGPPHSAVLRVRSCDSREAEYSRSDARSD
jgi:hypothetical protein